MKPKLFGEIALKKGLVSREQLNECLREQEDARLRGERRALGAIMHDKGYLTLLQVNSIMDEAEAPTQTRQTIDGYDIISKIGEGGMGTVYLARQVSLNKLVAIKILAPKLASNKDYLRRFKREAMATAKLNHSNIVQALDVGESRGYNYFVMEYVDGETVKDMLKRQGIIEEERVVQIATEVSRALQHAAELEIIHRDIKPANVMINKEGRVKLCDLGLAVDRKEDDASITKSGVIMGTPYYLSPEQAKNDSLDIRSDIYSLGATMFHMATGNVPFTGESAAVILTKHLTEPVPDPMVQNPILSKGLAYIIRRCMEKDPRNRYQKPDELLEDLSRMREPSFRGQTVIGEVDEEEVRGRPIGQLVVALLTVMVIIGMPLLILLIPDLRSEAGSWVQRLIGDEELSVKQARDEREQQARSELQQAKNFYATRERDFDMEALSRFRHVAESYPDTAAGREAERTIADLTELQKRSIHNDQLSMHREVTLLMEEQRYGEAIAIVSRYASRYETPEWHAITAGEQADVEQAATWALRNARLNEENCLRYGDFLSAIRGYEALTLCGLESIEQEANQAVALLETRMAQETGSAHQVAAAELVMIGEVIDLILAPASDGIFAGAGERGQKLLENPEYESIRPLISWMLTDIRTLEELILNATRTLEGRLHEHIVVPVAGVMRIGTIEAIEGQRLTLLLDGTEVVFPITAIDPDYLIRLGGYNPGTDQALLLKGLLHLALGSLERAITEFELASSKGLSVQVYLDVIRGRLQPR